MAEADDQFSADPKAQQELARWSRWEDELSPDEHFEDGIPRAAVARGSMASSGVFRQRNFDVDGSGIATEKFIPPRDVELQAGRGHLRRRLRLGKPPLGVGKPI